MVLHHIKNILNVDLVPLSSMGSFDNLPRPEIINDVYLAYNADNALYVSDNFQQLKTVIHDAFQNRVYVKQWHQSLHLTLAYCKNVSSLKYNDIIKGIIDLHHKYHKAAEIVFDSVQVVGTKDKKLALVSKDADLTILRGSVSVFRQNGYTAEYADHPLVHMTLLDLRQRQNAAYLNRALQEINDYLKAHPVKFTLNELNLIEMSPNRPSLLTLI